MPCHAYIIGTTKPCFLLCSPFHGLEKWWSSLRNHWEDVVIFSWIKSDSRLQCVVPHLLSILSHKLRKWGCKWWLSWQPGKAVKQYVDLHSVITQLIIRKSEQTIYCQGLIIKDYSHHYYLNWAQDVGSGALTLCHSNEEYTVHMITKTVSVFED